MALSRVKTWSAGEVLLASDLNAEYNNILNNAASLINPLGGNLTFSPDATYDIGALGATRPRDLYMSRNLVVGGTMNVTGVATLGTGAILGTPASGTLTNATGLPISTGVSGLGTGVATALAVNVGSAGAFVTFNGALGTPSSGTATNLTGTSGITGTGALNSGSITSGFGSIDIGTDALTAGAATFSGNLSVSKTGVASSTLESTQNGQASYVINKAKDSGGTAREVNYGLGVFADDAFSISNGTTERLRMVPSTGIFTMTAYGAGTATFSAAGVISSVSDERLKIKDGSIKNATAMVMLLEPGYYYGKPDANMGPDRQLGFYAQNVHKAIGEEAAPTPKEQIRLNKDGTEQGRYTAPWGYFDRSVLAVVVEALKEKMKEIEVMKARIAALESK